MSDHLPECPPWAVITGNEADCICDRLRACEQRVLLSKPNIELSAVYGYEAGRSDGLNAARDAVANLPVAITVVHDTPFLNKQGMGVCENPDKYPHGIVQVAALAAIDALRGDV